MTARASFNAPQTPTIPLADVQQLTVNRNARHDLHALTYRSLMPGRRWPPPIPQSQPPRATGQKRVRSADFEGQSSLSMLRDLPTMELTRSTSEEMSKDTLERLISQLDSPQLRADHYFDDGLISPFKLSHVSSPVETTSRQTPEIEPTPATSEGLWSTRISPEVAATERPAHVSVTLKHSRSMLDATSLLTSFAASGAVDTDDLCASLSD